MIVTRWQAPVIPDEKQIREILEREGLKPFKENFKEKVKFKDVRSPFSEVRFVMKGELIVNVSGNKLLLREGDRITLPSNTLYSLSAEQEECICICAHKIS